MNVVKTSKILPKHILKGLSAHKIISEHFLLEHFVFSSAGTFVNTEERSSQQRSFQIICYHHRQQNRQSVQAIIISRLSLMPNPEKWNSTDEAEERWQLLTRHENYFTGMANQYVHFYRGKSGSCSEVSDFHTTIES